MPMIDRLETLREIHGTAILVATGAFLIGILFGFATEISRYCNRLAFAE